MRRITAEALTDKLASLQEKANGLSTRITTAQGELDTLTNTYARLSRKIADLNEELAAPVETQAEELARAAARGTVAAPAI